MVEDKLNKALRSINFALENYKEGNKLLAKGDIDYAREYVEASMHLLFAEMEEEDNEDLNNILG
jgi:hypothetical protein